MDINNSKIDDRKTSQLKSTTTIQTIKYGAFSVVAHLLLVAVLFSGLLFAEDKIVDNGEQSIKAVMVDLSMMAAPEQSFAEKTELAKKSDTVDNNEKQKEPAKEPSQEEKLPDETPDKVEPVDQSVPPKIMRESIVRDIQKNMTKPHRKRDHAKRNKKAFSSTRSDSELGTSTLTQVNQQISSENIAPVAVASSISDNINYAQHAGPISRNQPEYPRRALEMQIEGYVVVKYDVNSEGRVENIRFIESVPNNIFNRTVIMAMKTWKYRPVAVKDLTTRIVFNRNRSISFN